MEGRILGRDGGATGEGWRVESEGTVWLAGPWLAAPRRGDKAKLNLWMGATQAGVGEHGVCRDPPGNLAP